MKASSREKTAFEGEVYRQTIALIERDLKGEMPSERARQLWDSICSATNAFTNGGKEAQQLLNLLYGEQGYRLLKWQILRVLKDTGREQKGGGL